MPSEDSDKLAYSRNLIRIFTGCILDSQGGKVSSCAGWFKFSFGSFFRWNFFFHVAIRCMIGIISFNRVWFYHMTCAPCEDSDQSAHLHRLNRDFIGCSAQGFFIADNENWSDCADTQADSSFRWAHISIGTFSRCSSLDQNKYQHQVPMLKNKLY